jgi:hypothetical protein
MKFPVQTTLDQYPPSVNEVKKARLDHKFALALYTTGKSFSTFDDPTWTDFFKELGYTPPTRQALVGSLLNSVYKDTKDEVEEVVKGAELGLVTDESTDVSLNRLANYLFLLPDGTSFYWRIVDIKERTQNAANIAEEAIQVGKELTRGELWRITSFATDTCLTNQNVWTQLSNTPEMKHVIIVPCDSHGLQLLIKDLLNSVPSINATWQKASTIANTLRNATKQYQFLRRQQEMVYGKQKALIAAGFTSVMPAKRKYIVSPCLYALCLFINIIVFKYRLYRCL